MSRPSADSIKFVDLHTAFRKAVNPPARNMKAISWSDDLAKSSEDWGKKCQWKHSGKRGVGENLYLSSQRQGARGFDPVADAVNSWGNEKVNYDYATNTCQPGQICGHYTQVVWADTDKVGCAVVDCPSVSGAGSAFNRGGTMVVCQYTPPGNYVGQKPYRS